MAFPTTPQLNPILLAMLMQAQQQQSMGAAPFAPNFAPQLQAQQRQGAAAPMMPLSPPAGPGGAPAGGASGGLGSMNPQQLAALAQMGKGILGMFGSGASNMYPAAASQAGVSPGDFMYGGGGAFSTFPTG